MHLARIHAAKLNALRNDPRFSHISFGDYGGGPVGLGSLAVSGIVENDEDKIALKENRRREPSAGRRFLQLPTKSATRAVAGETRRPGQIPLLPAPAGEK